MKTITKFHNEDLKTLQDDVSVLEEEGCEDHDKEVAKVCDKHEEPADKVQELKDEPSDLQQVFKIKQEK